MTTRTFNTQEEFIKSVMSGDIWIDEDGLEYSYDSNYHNPFRLTRSVDNKSNIDLYGVWSAITQEDFTLKQPEHIIERRWKMCQDSECLTSVTLEYYNQKLIDSERMLKDFYKHPTDFIDITLQP